MTAAVKTVQIVKTPGVRGGNAEEIEAEIQRDRAWEEGFEQRKAEYLVKRTAQ